MSTKLLSSTEFGDSEFGSRLDYKSPPYRDIVFGILYYLHLGGVFGAAIYLWIIEYPKLETNPLDWQSDIKLNGIFTGVAVCTIVGIVFGLLWLQVMKRFAGAIIKFMIYLNIGCWAVVTVVGFATNMVLGVIGAIFLLLTVLWAWCIWNRIPFAAALISIASTIISKYGGTIFLALAVIVLDVIWIFAWGAMTSAYYMIDDEPNTFVVFLLFVSFYWGFQVNQNVSHTTTCGVAATWYFSTVESGSPTGPAFKRTMTTSFGSVCLGSLIVAVLQALQAIIRNMQNGLIQWFNKYAYAQCAIYGTSFITSAKRTWGLLSSRGIMALINDDLTGMVIVCGALVGGVVAGGAGFAIGYAFYGGNADDQIRWGFSGGLAVYGFLIGLILCQTVLYVVPSAVICLFVCYSEDPAAMEQNRPEEYNRIVQAKPSWRDVGQ